MNEYDIKRLALVLSIQAEIEGMKAENLQKQIEGGQIAYSEIDFYHKAQLLNDLGRCHNEQL